jgi:zinc finger CCCH domain-containing protein 13
MDSRPRRTLSPGSRRLAIPGRTSGSSFEDYDDPYYSRSPRDYIPSRDPYYSSLPRTSTIDAYSGRPRRSTLTKERPIITTSGAPPVSPSRYERDDRDDYGKPIVSGRTAHKKVYSVAKDGSRLVDERDVSRGEYSDTERPKPQERRYHLTGSYNRPREVDEDSYSYTDAAGMYRDTEPRFRRRRGSVEGGIEGRRGSLIDYDLPPRAHTKDFTAPPTSRALDRYNESLARRETAPLAGDARTSSRDRSGTYDPYPSGSAFEMTGRGGTRHLSTVDMPYRNDDRYGKYDRSPVEDELDPRRSRQRFKDDQVESRGFGIRSQIIGKPESSPERNHRATEGLRPISSIYATEPAIPQPNIRDYLPPPSIEDERREREREREREKQEHDRDLREVAERERAKRERERELNSERDRDRDRDYERRRDKDDYERYDERYDDRERTRRDRANSDHLRHATNATVAAAGVGAAAYAAHVGAEKREKERERDRDREPLRDTPREREREAIREAPRERDRDISRDIPREREREVIKESLREAPRDRERELSRDPARDIPRESAKETLRESTRELPRDVARDVPRERDRERERDRDRDREHYHRHRHSSDEDQLPARQASRREPNDREDAVERKYTDERRKDTRNLDPDEDYNRRLLQAQKELEQLSVPGETSAQSPSQSRHNSMLDSGITHESPIDLHNPTMAGALPIPDREVAPAAATSAPMSKDNSRDTRVRIVEPPKEELAPAPIRGILRKPTQKFPEHKDEVREGVKPLKEEAERKGIPTDAKWTKIDRRLVNPEALDAAQERYEERLDCVIVLRVLTKAEIQKLADKTREIRGMLSLALFCDDCER